MRFPFDMAAAVASPTADAGARDDLGRAEPRVSVIMSVHDGNVPHEVAAAVASIQGQSLGHFDFLVLSDGIRRDDLRSLLQRFAEQDRRVQLLEHPHNRGISQSLNTLLQAARTPYIAVMDGDDISAPQRLERQLEFLESNTEIDIVGCGATEIDAKGQPIFDKQMPTDPDEIRRFMCFRDPLVHPSVMYRRSLFDRLGFYDESVAYAFLGDTELWSRALLAGCRIANLPEPLYYFRRNGSFLNRRRGWRLATAELRLRANYIRQSGLPLYRLFLPLAVCAVRVCPIPVLRWAYQHLRNEPRRAIAAKKNGTA